MNNKKLYLFFLVDDSSGLLWQVLIFSSKHSKSAEIVAGCFIDMIDWSFSYYEQVKKIITSSVAAF